MAAHTGPSCKHLLFLFVTNVQTKSAQHVVATTRAVFHDVRVWPSRSRMILWLLCVGVVAMAAATAASSRPSAARADELDAMREWARNQERGFVSSKLDVRTVVGKGEMLVARAAIRSNERLAESRPFSPARVLEISPEWKSLQLDEFTLMGLMLAVERFHRYPDTWMNRLLMRAVQHWGPFVTALPSRCMCALYFDERDLDWLAGLIGHVPQPSRQSLQSICKSWRFVL